MGKDSKKDKKVHETPTPAHSVEESKSSKSKDKSHKSSSKSSEKHAEKHTPKPNHDAPSSPKKAAVKHAEPVKHVEKHVEQSPKESKPRRKSSKKDPNRPKRPPSGYLLFCQAHRDKVKETHPEYKTTEVTAHLGHLWKELTDKDKEVRIPNRGVRHGRLTTLQPYELEAKAKSAEYKEEVKEYDAHHPVEHKPTQSNKSSKLAGYASADVTIPGEQLEHLLQGVMGLKSAMDQLVTGLQPLLKHSPHKTPKRSLESEASADEAPAAKKKRAASEYKKQLAQGAPKRPSTSFLLFRGEHFDKHKAAFEKEHPGKKLDMKIVGKMLAEEWATLNPKEKERYQEMAKKNKEQYTEAKKKWDDEHSGDEGADSPKKSPAKKKSEPVRESSPSSSDSSSESSKSASSKSRRSSSSSSSSSSDSSDSSSGSDSE